MKRGDIYLVKRRDTIGAEIAKTRPAVIVSNDALNASSQVVEVVYLTTQPKKELPTHATIHATGVTSTAICEQVDSVSLSLPCAWVGTCSDEEMADIDRALMASLGLTTESIEPEKEPEGLPSCIDSAVKIYTEAIKAIAERDAYKEILDKLLEERRAQG